MSNEQLQTVPPRLDGHSYQPVFGLYDSRCKVELPPGIQIGSFAWDEWNRSLSPESFETIRPQSMAELLEWLGEGKLKPYISKQFSLDDGAQAIRWMMDRKAMGKVLVRM